MEIKKTYKQDLSCNPESTTNMRSYRTGLLLAFIFTFTLSACGILSPSSSAGGPLPVLVTQQTEETDGDVLNIPQPVEPTTHVTTYIDILSDDAPVSRAMVAKMLSLAYSDMLTINTMPAAISFSDVPETMWYYKYINAAFTLGLMAGTGEIFKPDDPLSFGQAHQLLTALDPARKLGIAEPTDANRNTPISYALWVEMYTKLLDAASEDKTIFDAFGLEGANIIPMVASSNNPALTDWQFIADTGAFTCAGLRVDDFIDREIRVFHKNREIVAWVAVLNEIPTIANAYIVDADVHGIVAFSGGAQRYYTYGANVRPPNAAIADVTVENGVAVAINPAEENLSGTLLKITSGMLELKEWGLLPVATDFKIFSNLEAGQVQWKNAHHLLVGADMADFYIKNGAICAAVINKTIFPETIRVLIGTSDYNGLNHTGVTVTSNTGFTVQAGNDTKTFAAGQRFSVSDIENTHLFGQPRVFIHTDDPRGRLQIVGLRRNWPDNASPQYRGHLEIAAEDNGYTIINVLSLEEYLYAVVPSEMPSSYGVEAAKAQAVTARSYAYNQFYENRYRAHGAHVDDSVISQVYNNIPENKVSIEAVDATRGECLTYNGDVISANFFSTSGGMSANSGEVWANSGAFPAVTPEYLRAQVRYEGESFGDLRIEENAARFYKDKTIQSHDSHISWFRWEVQMTADEIAASINASLNTRRQAVPNLVQASAAHIGELVDLSVIRRGEAGNIMEMRITGTESEAHVQAEYNVRVLLAPKQYIHGGREIRLYRKDGTYVLNYGLLPSGFFTMDKEYDDNGKLTGIAFYGGGNGHGVGMSQNGAKGMIDKGYDYKEVLMYYYPGTAILRRG